MASLPMSPRLPGVTLLVQDATGPQYTRWKREVQQAFTARRTWGHCDGSDPMPMPESGPNFFSPVVASNPQPELLEERKAWTKKDRDVKLDIFLSITDDVKLEVFEACQQPPPSMSAMEMMQALDEQFKSFKFEDYHHVFCHFLNLHIDQYANLEEFNAEFQATLEDLQDHGYPLDNNTVCSAYFSKLRCTQNPWVAKKLAEWDSLATPPLLADLMKDCPPWMVIRPLATKAIPTSQHSTPESSYSEDLLDTLSLVDQFEEVASMRSSADTVSSSASSHVSHSRNSSKNSNLSALSQEITVKASMEDLAQINHSLPVPKQKSPKKRTKRSNKKPSLSLLPKVSPIPPPLNRPLPPLPAETASRRSISPRLAPTSTPVTTPADRSKTPSPAPQLETPQNHDKAEPQLPDLSHIHPALRFGFTTRAPASQPSVTSAPSLAPPSAPEPYVRPQTSQSSTSLAPPFQAELLPSRPSSSRDAAGKNSFESFYTWPARSSPLLTIESRNSSNISLPLQGTTIPEYEDVIMSGNGSAPSIMKSSTFDPSRLSSSPPRSLMSRMSAELNDDDKKTRKRSWGLKARLSSRKSDIKEMI